MLEVGQSRQASSRHRSFYTYPNPTLICNLGRGLRHDGTLLSHVGTQGQVLVHPTGKSRPPSFVFGEPMTGPFGDKMYRIVIQTGRECESSRLYSFKRRRLPASKRLASDRERLPRQAAVQLSQPGREVASRKTESRFMSRVSTYGFTSSLTNTRKDRRPEQGSEEPPQHC